MANTRYVLVECVDDGEEPPTHDWLRTSLAVNWHYVKFRTGDVTLFDGSEGIDFAALKDELS